MKIAENVEEKRMEERTRGCYTCSQKEGRVVKIFPPKHLLFPAVRSYSPKNTNCRDVLLSSLFTPRRDKNGDATKMNVLGKRNKVEKAEKSLRRLILTHVF